MFSFFGMKALLFIGTAMIIGATALGTGCSSKLPYMDKNITLATDLDVGEITQKNSDYKVEGANIFGKIVMTSIRITLLFSLTQL